MSSLQAPKGYRPNVGVVLFNAQGRVWIGRRANASAPYCWQFPQGGIDEGESAEAAAMRELEEETGIAPGQVSRLGEIPDWLSYDFPPEVAALPRHRKRGWIGQAQRWFACRYSGKDSDIDLDRATDDEFDAWRWEILSAVPALIIPWKRDIYERVASEFARFTR